nr:unnamed protein product [Spirometra erinaceieuropaei]
MPEHSENACCEDYYVTAAVIEIDRDVKLVLLAKTPGMPTFLVANAIRLPEGATDSGSQRRNASRQYDAISVEQTVSTAAADVEETLIGVFGGSVSGIIVKPISSCEVYDVRQDRWHKLPDLPEARVRPAAACLPGDSQVFVFGVWNPRDTRLAAGLQSGDSRAWNNFSVVFCGLDKRRTALASVVFCHLRADWRRRRQEATSAGSAVAPDDRGMSRSSGAELSGIQKDCLMFQISNWIGAADKEKWPCPFNIRPRVRQTFSGAHRDPTIFLFGKDRPNRWSVLRWNPRLQQAERVADMEAGRTGAFYSVVSAGYFMHSFFSHHQTEENIFVVGGEWGERRVGEFLVREGRWRERASLAVGRWGHAAAVVKVPTAAAEGEETLIGVFGGSKGGILVNPIVKPMSSCKVYDVRQDRWHELPDLPKARARPAAACLPGDSRDFVFGGRHARGTRPASVVFCHLRADWHRRRETTSADFWESAAPMRTARWGLAATAFRGTILVAGGADGRDLNTVEMFTPPDARSPLGQWTELAHMQEPRCRFTLLTSANAVFALGNGTSGEPGNTVEAFAAPDGSANPDNNLTAWVWSSQRPGEMLNRIHGAASIRL